MALGESSSGMFRPRMTSSIEGISVLGDLKWRAFDGVIADVWSVACGRRAHGEYVSEDPRLFVVLEMEGPGGLTLRHEAGWRRITEATPMSVSYIPAGYPLRGDASGLTRLRHLDLHLDTTAMTRRLSGALGADRLDMPLLGIRDESVAAIARLIAAECESEAPLADLYGEGLLTAMLTALFRVAPREGRRRSPLSPRQLQRVQAYIEEHCLENIRLGDLAGLAGLSQTYFSHAFKASTGMGPSRWHMRARIRRVQQLLLRKDASLTEVAALAGFADQAHLTRVFKQHVGDTPAAWLRHHAT